MRAFLIKLLLIILPLVFITLDCYCQDNAETMVDQLNNTARKNLVRPDTMIIYADKAYELAKKHDYKTGEATALKFKGIYEYGKSNFDAALNYYQQSLNIFSAQNNALEIGKGNLNIAMVYESRRDYVNTMKYALAALTMFEKVGDNNGRGRVLNLLGITSDTQKNYRQAISYFKAYNTLVTTAKDSVEIATSFNNLGAEYTSLHMTDSAMYFLKKALKLDILVKDKDGEGKNYENIASLYEEKNDIKSALAYTFKSMAIYSAMGNKRFLSHAYGNAGHFYKKLKDTTNAVAWFNKALTLAKSVGENEVVAESYRQLSEIQATDQQYKKAYENLKRSANANDSILNTATTRAVEEYRAKYETEKKERQVAVLKQQTAQQELQLQKKNVYLAVAVLLLVTAAGAGYLFYARRKANERILIQQEINRQQEITAHEVLNAEERERRRMGSDLHDGVGQLLSTALLSLNRLVKLGGFNDEQQKLAEQSLSLVTDGYDEVRSISHQIIPNALLKYGLSAAVRDFLSKIDDHVLKVSLETVGITKRLDEQMETILYRVIQETVNNVIKHAKASRLSIQLVKDEDGINLSVEDNGKGFNPDKLNKDAGIGMKNIYSRVAFLKGIVDIQSGEGKGTLVSVFVPA